MAMQNTVQRADDYADMSDEDRATQQLIDGVLAFDELADASLTVANDSPPTMPSGVPNQYRMAMRNLIKAKTYRWSLGMPMPKETVAETIKGSDLASAIKYMFSFDVHVKQEKLRRYQTAKATWQLARPTIAKMIKSYAALDGGSAGYADQLRSEMLKIDDEMTQMIPDLIVELQTLDVPNIMGIMDGYQKAKESASYLTLYVESIDRYDKMTGALTGDDGDLSTDLADKHALAMTNLKGLKAILETPEKWASNIKKMQDAKTGDWGVSKAGFDLVNDGLKLVKDAALPVIDYTGAACVYMADKIEFSANVADEANLPLAKKLRVLGGRLPDIAKNIDGYLGPVVGLIDIFSGISGVMDGIEQNDFEETANSLITIGEGAAGLIEGIAVYQYGAAAAGLGVTVAPLALSAKGMVQVTADTSRMLQNIRNAEVRKAVEEMYESMKGASTAAAEFNIAFSQYVQLMGSSDPVEQKLAQKFGKVAIPKVIALHNAMGDVVSSAVQGEVSEHPEVANAFHEEFGGHTMSTAFLLSLGKTKDVNTLPSMVSHANYVQEYMDPLASAVAAANKKVQKLEKDAKGKVGIWSD